MLHFREEYDIHMNKTSQMLFNEKNDILAHMDRLDEEVYALMSQAHIVVLTGINPYWT